MSLLFKLLNYWQDDYFARTYLFIYIFIYFIRNTPHLHLHKAKFMTD